MPKKDQHSLRDIRKQAWAFTVSAVEMVPFEKEKVLQQEIFLFLITDQTEFDQTWT